MATYAVRVSFPIRKKLHVRRNRLRSLNHHASQASQILVRVMFFKSLSTSGFVGIGTGFTAGPGARAWAGFTSLSRALVVPAQISSVFEGCGVLCVAADCIGSSKDAESVGFVWAGSVGEALWDVAVKIWYSPATQQQRSIMNENTNVL